METITKIIRAKDKKISIEIPEDFLDKDIKVTIEALSFPSDKSEIEKNLEDFLKKLDELREKTKQVTLPENVDIDDLIDEGFYRD